MSVIGADIYALLTRAPVLRRALDLHVLGTPPAFVLSQDQTLRCITVILFSSVSITRLLCATCFYYTPYFQRTLSRISHFAGTSKLTLPYILCKSFFLTDAVIIYFTFPHSSIPSLADSVNLVFNDLAQ